MVNLEQVKLLEAKVAKTIDYVERLSRENAALHSQKAELRTKMDAYQKRIDELEVLVSGFKDDQDQIEEGILSALDRLGQFEKAMEKTLRKPAGKVAKEEAVAAKEAVAVKEQAAEPPSGAVDNPASGEGQTCFEIPEAAVAAEAAEGGAPKPAENGELDIF